jgi:hypothetical protein
MEDKKRYYSYVLRMWLAGDKEQSQWHTSLEDTRTGERRGFASLPALFEYLDQQTGQPGEHKKINKGGRKS